MTPSVTEYLSRDHVRLGLLIDRASTAMAEGRLAEARDGFRAFREALVRHLRLEDELVFPLFEVRTGLVGGGPTGVMHDEHRDIRGALERLDAALRSEDPAAFAQGQAFLHASLADHTAKEERVIYPMLDGLLSEQERRRFVERLERER